MSNHHLNQALSYLDDLDNVLDRLSIYDADVFESLYSIKAWYILAQAILKDKPTITYEEARKLAEEILNTQGV